VHDHADEMSFLSILFFFMANLKFVKWGLKKALTITRNVHLFVVFYVLLSKSGIILFPWGLFPSLPNNSILSLIEKFGNLE
jgi:hypothetical protein